MGGRGGRQTVSLSNRSEWHPVTFNTLMSSFFCCWAREVRGCVRLALLSLCRRTPTGSNNAPPMLRDFNKTMTKRKSFIPQERHFFFRLLPLLLANTPEKFCDAGKKSDKYHLLLMSLRTFGASLASAALRHCITIRWLSVGSATDGILLKTDFAFELAHIPRQKSIATRLRRCDRLP